MKDRLIEFQKEVAVGANNKDCKECRFFSIKNNKLICNFDPFIIGAECILMRKALGEVP